MVYTRRRHKWLLAKTTLYFTGLYLHKIGFFIALVRSSPLGNSLVGLAPLPVCSALDVVLLRVATLNAHHHVSESGPHALIGYCLRTFHEHTSDQFIDNVGI